MKEQLDRAAEATRSNDYSLVKTLRNELDSCDKLNAFAQMVFSEELSLDALFHGLTIIIDCINTSLFGKPFCKGFAANFDGFKLQVRRAVDMFSENNSGMCQSLLREISRFVALVIAYGMSHEQIFEQMSDFSSAFSIQTIDELLGIIFAHNDYEAFDSAFIDLFQRCVSELMQSNHVQLASSIISKLIIGPGQIVCPDEFKQKSLPCDPVYQGALQICTESNFISALFQDYGNCQMLLLALSNVCSLFSEQNRELHRAFVQILHSNTLEFLLNELESGQKFKISAAYLLYCQAQEYRADIHESGSQHLIFPILKQYDDYMIQTQETASFVDFSAYLHLYVQRIRGWNYQVAQNIGVNVDLEYIKEMNKQASLILNYVFKKPASLQICYPDVTGFWQEIIQLADPGIDFLRSFVDMVTGEDDFLVNFKFIYNICNVNIFLRNEETQEELVHIIKYMFAAISKVDLGVENYLVAELFISALSNLLTNTDTTDIIEFNLPEEYIERLMQLMKYMEKYAQVVGINRACDIPSNYELQDIEQPNYFQTVRKLVKLLFNCTTSTPELLIQLFDEGFCLFVEPVDIVNLLQLYYQLADEAFVPESGGFLAVYMHVVHLQIDHNSFLADADVLAMLDGITNQFALLQLIHQIAYDFQHSLSQLFWMGVERLLYANGSIEVVDFVLSAIFDIMPKFVFDIDSTALLESFSSRFSSENLHFTADFLAVLFAEHEGRCFIAAPLLRIVSLIITTASEQLCSEDEIIFDRSVSATAYECENILSDFLEEDFLFDAIQTFLNGYDVELALELLELLLAIPPTRKHYEQAQCLVVLLIEENLAAPLRGEGRITERELGLLLSKADNPLTLVCQAYEQFCTEYGIQADVTEMERYIEEDVRIDGLCCILLPDELRRLVESVKKFCFK